MNTTTIKSHMTKLSRLYGGGHFHERSFLKLTFDLMEFNSFNNEDRPVEFRY